MARVRGAGGPARLARTTRGAWRERAAALPGGARLGGGSAPAHGRRRGNGGSLAWRQRRGATATGERRAARDGGGPSVGGLVSDGEARRAEVLVRRRARTAGCGVFGQRRARGGREVGGAGEAGTVGGGTESGAAVGRA
jgi:hypothetical protein